MAPESEARERAFYDHEIAEPRRQRRAAADWGVNEDIFDRMPSRFARVERRVQHEEIVLRRDDAAGGVAVIERAEPIVRGRGDERDRGGDEARGRFARSGVGARVRGDESARGGEPVARVRGNESVHGGEPVARVRGDEGVRGDEDGARVRVSARTERASHGRTDASELDPRAAARAIMSWGEDLDDGVAPMVPGETRTIVLSRDEAPAHDDSYSGGTARRDTSEFGAVAAEGQERRTVKISGHPDRLPVPRTQRRPQTAMERIGHRPDRIVAYAVALGFLLVLIAVLTTGQ